MIKMIEEVDGDENVLSDRAPTAVDQIHILET